MKAKFLSLSSVVLLLSSTLPGVAATYSFGGVEGCGTPDNGSHQRSFGDHSGEISDGGFEYTATNSGYGSCTSQVATRIGAGYVGASGAVLGYSGFVQSTSTANYQVDIESDPGSGDRLIPVALTFDATGSLYHRVTVDPEVTVFSPNFTSRLEFRVNAYYADDDTRVIANAGTIASIRRNDNRVYNLTTEMESVAEQLELRIDAFDTSRDLLLEFMIAGRTTGPYQASYNNFPIADYVTGTASFDAMNTLSFAKTGQAISLPDGFSANSIGAGVVNGYWSDPRIAIAPIPVPAAGFLLLSAVCGLRIIRRRKS
ncbi:hypothetical protein GG681_09485 [Epibacterium sp. SM1969]|uniref:Uncharacterized protein n=1 Tax=Tritonibacter aquimaris TaxID=2663379 RepID=A0A844AWW0_9RHOB|nr:VPLPA-CTERM sorting domain-containing protein [Tritonibacter aquimaris]MQY42874.1 hypothetical protein [Tritonibacter aquimaris]